MTLQHCALRTVISLLAGLWLHSAPLFGQDSAEQGTNSRGSRAEIAVTVRDGSGQVIAVPTSVKLYKNGTPEDQRSTSQGRAFFIPRSVGDFTITVEAAGYKAAQKEVSLSVPIQYQVDVYLEPDTASGVTTGVPGGPLLAPKAKEALEKGWRALRENKVEEAQKYIGEAMKLAPGNPDVLYAQGMVYMTGQNWERAQSVLEKASQIDPRQSRILAALGMDLCNQKKYQEAIPFLEKSIQSQVASGWETEYALAKSYYYQGQYEQALKMAEQAHSESHSSAPQAELLLAQCLTAVGRYEDSARTLREFLKNNGAGPDAVTARRWLDRLSADGKIHR
jgi:Tfp pilus assembly protein PilF